MHKFILVKISACLLIFLLTGLTCFSQNLVPNGSFENVSSCPSALSQIGFASPWTDAVGSATTADLFNACHVNSNPVTCQDVGVPQNFSGSALAHTGDGYAGILVYYGSLLREYIQVPLDSSLSSGSAYRVEMWIRRSSLCHFAADKIGILISTGAVNQPGNSNIPVAPQFETAAVISNDASWTLLSGIYIAAGGEDHITIGNFSDNASTTIVNMGLPGGGCPINTASAYYYVDDVNVERIDEFVVITGDTMICPGMSTTLTALSSVSTWWSTTALPNDTFSTAGSIVVSPTVTSTYFLNGLMIRDSVVVYVVPPPLVNLGNDTAICQGEMIALDAGNAGSVFIWSSGETDQVISAGNNQLYWVIADNGGCSDSDSLNLTVLPNPPVSLGPDSVFCANGNEFLELDAGPGMAYSWLPGGDTTQTVTVNTELTYTVTVTHDNGCIASGSISTVETCPVTVFIPNAFTPNDDGKNEFFLPVINYPLFYEMKIFNHWGTMIFATSNPAEGWNGIFKGSKMPSGNYFFIVKYGSLTDSQRIDKKTIKGNVILVR